MVALGMKNWWSKVNAVVSDELKTQVSSNKNFEKQSPICLKDNKRDRLCRYFR